MANNNEPNTYFELNLFHKLKIFSPVLAKVGQTRPSKSVFYKSIDKINCGDWAHTEMVVVFSLRLVRKNEICCALFTGGTIPGTSF